MSIIEVYADVLCPFTHVGLRRLREVREARGSTVAVRVHAWPLEMVNGEPLDRELVASEVDALRSQVVPELFARFDADRFPTTSLPAFGLAAAAYAVNDGVGEAVSLAVRDALFEQGQDVTDADVLRTIGTPFGVIPLDDQAAEAAVRADWVSGTARGVKGSPHFFTAGRNWFCPSLNIRHEDGRYDIRLDIDAMEDFYGAALV